MQEILDNLEAEVIIERVGLHAAVNNELGSEFINPVIILPKGDTYKKVIDARLLNAITDTTKYHFPPLPVQVSIPKINGKIFSITDLTTAYDQVGLTPETQKLVHFVVGNEQYKNLRGSMAFMPYPVSSLV